MTAAYVCHFFTDSHYAADRRTDNTTPPQQKGVGHGILYLQVHVLPGCSAGWGHASFTDTSSSASWAVGIGCMYSPNAKPFRFSDS